MCSRTFGLFFLFGASARFHAVVSPISLSQYPLFLAAAFQFVSGAKIHFKYPLSILLCCSLYEASVGIYWNKRFIFTRQCCQDCYQLQFGSSNGRLFNKMWIGKSLLGNGGPLICCYHPVPLLGRQNKRRKVYGGAAGIGDRHSKLLRRCVIESRKTSVFVPPECRPTARTSSLTGSHFAVLFTYLS